MLEAKTLEKHFIRGVFKKKVFKIHNISFHLRQGEILGLMGPSGSGKTTIGRMLAGLIRPTKGIVRVDEMDFFSAQGKKVQQFYRKVQMIFQQPNLALDPKQTISQAVKEVLLFHKIVSTRKEADQRTLELFAETGLSNEIYDRFPHEISGGQAQRVVIARAISLFPTYLIADEPTSMLDLSVQAMILRLLQQFKKNKSMGILFISHNPDIIHAICDRVLYLQNGMLIPP